MPASATEQQSEKASYWSEHIDAWQRSGLSQGAYCRRLGLSQSSLSYWRARLNKSPGKGGSELSITIVPVPLSVPPHAVMTALEPILVHVGENSRIEIRGDFAAPVFEKLVRTLTRL